MKGRKQILSTVLTGLMLISLAGCQKKEPEIMVQEKQEQERTNISFTTAVSNQKVLQAFSNIIAAFETDYPDMHILFEGNSVGKDKTVAQVVEERVNAGLANDIMTMDVKNIFEYADQEKLADLTDTKVGKSLTDMARWDSTVDGKVVSVPTSMLSFGMWVNRDLLGKFDLAVPADWEEFIHCCEVLKANGHEPILGTQEFSKLFVLATMGDIYLSDDTDAIIRRLNSGEEKISKYTSPGFERVQYLIEQGYIDGPAAAQRATKDISGLLKTGEFAFVPATSGYVTPEDLSFDFCFIGLPATKGMISLLASDRRMVIMSDSKVPDGCIAFLDYFSEPETWDLVSGFGTIPAFTTQADALERDERLTQVWDNIDNGQTMLIQDYNLVFEQWNNLVPICDAMLTGSTAEEAAAAFDKVQADAVANAQ